MKPKLNWLVNPPSPFPFGFAFEGNTPRCIRAFHQELPNGDYLQLRVLRQGQQIWPGEELHRNGWSSFGYHAATTELAQDEEQAAAQIEALQVQLEQQRLNMLWQYYPTLMFLETTTSSAE